jgi:hypothetical protein
MLESDVFELDKLHQYLIRSHEHGKGLTTMATASPSRDYHDPGHPHLHPRFHSHPSSSNNGFHCCPPSKKAWVLCWFHFADRQRLNVIVYPLPLHLFPLKPDEQVDPAGHIEIMLGCNSSVSATPLLPPYKGKVQERACPPPLVSLAK